VLKCLQSGWSFNSNKIDKHSQARAELTPEQLEIWQQQDRQQHRNSRAALTPEQLEVQQQQDRDRHRRTTAAESVRITQDENDRGETFSIDMIGRPTATQLDKFEFDEDKALLLFYENSHDHVADLIQNLDDAAPGVETHVAKQTLCNTLDEMKITPNIQRVIQQRFNSLHDKNGLVIGCCCCGCTSILPTVSESGNKLPAPILSLFPTDPKFNPLKFTSDELNEFNDQHVLMKQVRSSMAANNNRERYHVHQELLRTIISEPIVNNNTESTSTSTTEDESPIHTNESNVVMDLAGNVADMSPTCRPDTAMSANFSRKGMSRRHTTRKKRPRHTVFVCRSADTDPHHERRGGGFTTTFCSLQLSNWMRLN
jgi:hypothetical protein